MPPVIQKSGDVLEVNISDCRGYEFMDAKDKIKEITGRRWDPESKNWLVPATADNADRLIRTIRPVDNPELLHWIAESKAQATEDLTTPLPDDAELSVPWGSERCEWQPEEVNDEKFTGLLPYQRSAVQLMAAAERIILGDDMGLGKTLTALSAVEEWKLNNPRKDGLDQDGPKLIVAPNAVTGGWVREIKRWLPEGTPVVAIQGGWSKAKRVKALTDGIAEDAWIIVNWEQVRIEKKRVKTKGGGEKTIKQMKEPLLTETQWLAVIADEVHKAKNPNSLQSLGLRRIQAPLMYGLTGTALMNSPDELWAVLAWLWPTDFHERGAAHSPGALAYWPFYNEFVEYYEDHNARKVITGVKNDDALRFLLRKRLIRRTADILGLKGRKRIYDPTIELNPGQRKLYDKAETELWLKVAEEAATGDKAAQTFIEQVQSGRVFRIPNGAARFVRLRQILESPALLGGDDDSAILDDLVERVLDSTPNPWTVFTEFKETNYVIQRRLEKHGLKVEVYNGDVAVPDRTKIEDAFQRGEVDVVVGTIKAMYQGITLTRGRHQYWVSRDVVPDINEQGEARNDRLGQQHQVLVYIPQPPGTVAADKVEVINRLKERIVRSVLPKIHIQEETHV